MTENQVLDYSEYEQEDDPSKQGDLGKIRSLARRQASLERQILEKEAELKVLKAQHRTVSETELPEMMDRLEIPVIRTNDGVSVQVEETVHAGISTENQDEAFQWLEENGHGGVIKRSFEILFGRNDLKWANRFEADLKRRKQQLNVRRTQTVHTQTLKKLVREILEKGEQDLPIEKFGVYRRRISKVSVDE